MKLTKLSLIATLAISAAVAGGDIAPVEPAATTPAVTCGASEGTTINGKLTGYYYTDDSQAAYDIFDGDASQLAFAATLDVSHKLTDWMTLNFSAVGYVNALKQPNAMYMEGNKKGAFFNVANATFNYADTVFVAGRQLVDTPMVGGFDWLLAPGAFEAYTVANSSIENVTFIGSYVRTFRENNTGDNFTKLDGDNWTVSGAYDNKTISGSLWYYNIDAADYTQVYADAGYDFGVAKILGQYVYTDWNAQEASNVFGVKATATLGAFNLMGAYTNISDNVAGWVGVMDGLYTSSWNTASGGSMGNNFKVEAGTEFAGITASASYAYYEYDQNAIAGTEDDGHEIDVILGYDLKDSSMTIVNAIDVNVVYTNTDYGIGDDTNALEVYANYKF